MAQWLDLTWLAQSVPIMSPIPSHKVFVDASLQGWGTHISSLTANGFWSNQESLHINTLGLKAVAKPLESLEDSLSKGPILIWSDNRTVVALIKAGRIRPFSPGKKRSV